MDEIEGLAAGWLIDVGLFMPGTVCPWCHVADVHEVVTFGAAGALGGRVRAIRRCTGCSGVWGER